MAAKKTAKVRKGDGGPVPRLRKGAAAATAKGKAANYTRSVRKGAPRKQAVAIMLSEAGQSKPRSKRKG